MLPSVRRGCRGMDLFSSFRKKNSLPVQISRIPFFFQPTDPCFVLIIDLQSRSHSRKHVLIGFQIRIVGMQSPGIHRGVRITKEGRIKSSLTTFKSKVGEPFIERGSVVDTTVIHQIHPCQQGCSRGTTRHRLAIMLFE